MNEQPQQPEKQIQHMMEQAGRLYQLLQMELEHLSTLRQETEKQAQSLQGLKAQIQQDLQKNLSTEVGNQLKHALEGHKNALGKLLEEKIGHSTKEIEKAALNAKLTTEHLEKITRLDWGFLSKIGYGFLFLIVGGLLVIGVQKKSIPSLAEIDQRKQTLSKLTAQGALAQVSSCGGQVCVRVIRNQCGFGPSQDYCVIDPK